MAQIAGLSKQLVESVAAQEEIITLDEGATDFHDFCKSHGISVSAESSGGDKNAPQAYKFGGSKVALDKMLAKYFSTAKHGESKWEFKMVTPTPEPWALSNVSPTDFHKYSQSKMSGTKVS